jgi:hypothetical protein
MAVQPGEVTLYADETPVELEPLLAGVGEYRYKDITRIECAFLCPQCDSEQFLESTPPLGPNQSYSCPTCDHVIEITPEWDAPVPEVEDNAGLARRVARRILPFANRIATSGGSDEDSVAPQYHIDHVLEFLADMALRRKVRILGSKNPSETLGLMMRLRTTERIRFATAVTAIVLLFAVGMWLFPGISLNLPLLIILMFLGGSVIYVPTESPIIPKFVLSRLRDKYNIPDVLNGTLFIHYADYYRYGQQLALGEMAEPEIIDRTPVNGVEHTPGEFEQAVPAEVQEEQPD